MIISWLTLAVLLSLLTYLLVGVVVVLSFCDWVVAAASGVYHSSRNSNKKNQTEFNFTLALAVSVVPTVLGVDTAVKTDSNTSSLFAGTFQRLIPGKLLDRAPDSQTSFGFRQLAESGTCLVNS